MNSDNDWNLQVKRFGAGSLPKASSLNFRILLKADLIFTCRVLLSLHLTVYTVHSKCADSEDFPFRNSANIVEHDSLN